jgi:hypothetical protein
MLEPIGIVSGHELTDARAAEISARLGAVETRARQYLQEPGEGAWHELVDALERAHGDDATHELLRAVEIHFRTSVPR